MAIVLDSNEPAIVRGIKTVGVGKKGSKPLSPELAQEILADVRAGRVPEAARGAFFAGLMAKGFEPQEEILKSAFEEGVFDQPHRLVKALVPDAPEFVQWLCVSLLNKQTLDVQTARDLGRFLFSNETGDAARGFIASYLRVRYETDDEYEGLWQAMQETIDPAFCLSLPDGGPLVQMAEPFDGNDHSYLVTPLLAQAITRQGYRVIQMVGRNSGPKLVFNLFDVAKLLDSSSGYYVNQADVSVALDRWVDIRRQTIKRPFLATLEKFIKPLPAQIIITSAFHPPYGEKMLTIAQRAGFDAAMVIRNGIEGSIAFALKRPVKILLSARQHDGSFLKHEIEIDPEQVLSSIPDMEEKRERLTAFENARLIKEYTAKGKSGDVWFDARVELTNAGVMQGLKWLKENTYGLG